MSGNHSHAPRRVATESLPVIGDGEGCLEILADRLREEPGVVSIEADFHASTLTVRYQPAQVSPETLNALADEIGGLFAQRVTLCEKREGAEACAECALRMGRSAPRTDGELIPTGAHGRIGLRRRSQPADAVELVRPLAHTKPWGARTSPAEQEEYSRGRSMIVLTGVCLASLAIGMVLERSPLPEWASHVAYAVSAVTGGWYALKSSLEALREGKFDVNLLMILAAVGAAGIGYVFEAAVLMFLFSLSNTLEVYTMGRTRQALKALLGLRPVRALVRRDGREVEVPAESVRVSEVVIVKPGESIPVDGDVEKGESLVDQSNLTGESVPVEKSAGHRVFAGTLNQQGSLEVRTTRAAGDTALARIVALVEEAQEQKSRTEEMAEWVGRYYTIAVIVGAAIMLFVPPLLMHHEWRASLYRAMTLLVVASPCALVIATPATVLSAIANAARHGILFKGGRHLEALGRVKVLAFDKTGTLTHGRFAVTDVVAIAGGSESDVLHWAAVAEKRSPHPLAQAVVSAAHEKHVTIEPADHLTNHLGKGLVAQSQGRTIAVGTAELFASLGATPPAAALERVRAFSAEAKTAMIVNAGEVWGVIAAADQMRANAGSVVRELRALGLTRLAMLSGDSAHTVDAIAKRANVDEAHGQLLPEDKVAVIAKLEEKHGPVAMIGDGVNDAPALARATVGIAMGGIGSDAAMESADVVLMSDDIGALPYAVRLAHRARAVVMQNLAIAVGVMLLLVIWVFAGESLGVGALKLPVAVSGHEGSTVVVILNGLRLLAGRRA